MSENVDNIILVRLREMDRKLDSVIERLDRMESEIEGSHAASQGAAYTAAMVANAMRLVDERLDALEGED